MLMRGGPDLKVTRVHVTGNYWFGARRSDDTDARSGVASGPMAAGSAYRVIPL
jgi:hypothetical protein